MGVFSLLCYRATSTEKKKNRSFHDWAANEFQTHGSYRKRRYGVRLRPRINSSPNAVERRLPRNQCSNQLDSRWDSCSGRKLKSYFCRKNNICLIFQGINKKTNFMQKYITERKMQEQ
ncbi:hypothetical protein ABFA07_005216 [Porites harrisoni]